MFNIRPERETSKAAEAAKLRIFRTGLGASLPFETTDGRSVLIYSDGSLGCAYRLQPMYLDTSDPDTVMAVERELVNAFALLDNRFDLTLQFIWRKRSSDQILRRHMEGITTGDPGIHRMSAVKVNFWKKKLTDKAVFDVSLEMYVRKSVVRNIPIPKLGIDMTKGTKELNNEHQRLVKEFEIDVGRIVKSMPSLHPARMSADEITASIYSYIWSDKASVPKYRPERYPMKHHFSGGDTEIRREHGYITMGDSSRNISVLSCHGLPDTSFMLMFSYLAVIQLPITATMIVRGTNTAARKNGLEVMLKRATNYATIFSARSQLLVQEIEQLQFDLENGNRLVEMEMYLTVEGTSARQLSEYVTEISNSALNMSAQGDGMKLVQEHAALFTCYLASIPGNAYFGTTDRSFTVKTDNLVNLLPLLGGRKPDKNPAMLLRTACATISGWDLFDSSLPANHGLIFGSTGSGKSFTTSMLILSVLAQDPAVFVVDKGGSYKRLCEVLGGSYIDIAAGKVAINPFEVPEGMDPSDRVPFWSKVLIAMVEDDGEKVDNLMKNFIDRVCRHMVGTFMGTDSFKKRKVRQIVLSDIVKELSRYPMYDVESNSPDLMYKDVQNRLAALLARWSAETSKGTSYHSKLLDNPETTINIQDASFVAFDLNGIESYPDIMRVVFLVIADLIKRRCEEDKGRKKLVIFDECWAMLKTQEGSAFLEELYRTMRKYGAAVWSISQDINDFAGSNIAGAIMSNIYQMLVLRQSSNKSLQAAQKILQLGDSEVEVIGKIQNRKGEYSEALLRRMNNNEPSYKIGIHPSPIEYWLATTDASDTVVYDGLVRQGMKPLEACFKLAQQYPNGYAAGQ